MTLRRPSPGTVLAAVALFVALGGPAQAAKTVGLKNNAVTSAKIKNKTIRASDLSAALVKSLRATPANSLTSAHVREGSLTGGDLAAQSIGGDRLAPASIAGDRLGANAVGSGHIADGTIGPADLGTNSVGATELADGSIDSGEVADGRLRGVDVGRFAGRLNDLDFQTIGIGECRAVTSPSLTAIAGNQNLADDVIVVTPQANFPDSASLYAKPQGTNQITVTICNHGAAALNLGTEAFEFLTLDTSGG